MSRYLELVQVVTEDKMDKLNDMYDYKMFQYDTYYSEGVISGIKSIFKSIIDIIRKLLNAIKNTIKRFFADNDDELPEKIILPANPDEIIQMANQEIKNMKRYFGKKTSSEFQDVHRLNDSLEHLGLSFMAFNDRGTASYQAGRNIYNMTNSSKSIITMNEFILEREYIEDEQKKIAKTVDYLLNEINYLEKSIPDDIQKNDSVFIKEHLNITKNAINKLLAIENVIGGTVQRTRIRNEIKYYYTIVSIERRILVLYYTNDKFNNKGVSSNKGGKITVSELQKYVNLMDNGKEKDEAKRSISWMNRKGFNTTSNVYSYIKNRYDEQLKDIKRNVVS